MGVTIMLAGWNVLSAKPLGIMVRDQENDKWIIIIIII